MDKIRIIEIKKDVFEDNDKKAVELREELKNKKTFLLNLMSSPGSGKTSMIMRTIERLKDRLNISVIEADIDSVVDAQKIATTGITAIQLQTGGLCHLDATMTKEGLDSLDMEALDMVILENVGNLVCPAEFDTGASKNAMILSVPEGDDKPLKYPLMFSIVDVLIISKIDCMPYFDFDMKAIKERALKLNPDITILEVSAKTEEGLDDWIDWLLKEVNSWNH
jgi:hydrogenase nickel incorporation protein HypB